MHYATKTLVALLGALACMAAAAPEGASPEDNLPPNIKRATWFGERADWSHDGSKVLFLSKTFGDAMECELATGIIRPVTTHYPNEGYTRALYLANDDVLLSGPEHFDKDDIEKGRGAESELWILDKSRTKKPVRLGERCSEGPAVSRKNMRIAWAVTHSNYPDRLPEGASEIWMADIQYDNGAPRLANKKLILESRNLPFKCTLETQNFRPPEERELTFSAYGYQGTEVMGLDLETGKVVNYSNAPNEYDEPEGMFPDGQYTCVECDRQNGKGDRFIDIWKLALDGSGKMDRLTYFSDYPGYKASNPVISDDGRYMAFQLAKSTEMAGVGHGIFIYDLK